MMLNMSVLKKTVCLILLIFFVVIKSVAQKTEKFYDIKWKACKPNVARFYSVTTKTDSGYFRKDYFIKERRLKMAGNYLDSVNELKNGRFSFYYANGVLESSGRYAQNKKEGLWLSFHSNGSVRDSTVYADGNPIGKSLSWYSNGYPHDSISLNADRSGLKFSWFDNGVVGEAGRYSPGMKQDGRWKYFHKNGIVSSIELYDKSKLVSRQYFNDKGELTPDTANTDRRAQFAGGDEAWLKYISKKIYFPDEYKIANGDIATVVVTFTVNENGTIENVITTDPFDKRFDEIAEEVVRKSPGWIPAMEHNRKIKQVFHQPIVFSNYKE